MLPTKMASKNQSVKRALHLPESSNRQDFTKEDDGNLPAMFEKEIQKHNYNKR